MIRRIAVACHNANGEPDFYFVKVECSELQYEEGYAYEQAEIYADLHGYEEPYVSFDCDSDAGGRAIADKFTWQSATIVGNGKTQLPAGNTANET